MELPLDRYRITTGSPIDLADHDPGGHGPFSPDGEGKDAARDLLKAQRDRLAELQRLLYADGGRALLVVLQAMDAGGKDGTIRKVFSGVNPQGVEVTNFKAPSAEELAHDFLWRINRALPRRGMIGVFNRSHYEDVLIVRVKELVPESVWSQRYAMIDAFERRLAASGTAVLKLFLHIDKGEQRQRLQARLDDPSKHWKFNPADLAERARWEAYMGAFEAAVGRCSSPEAPWMVVPANRKWYRNVVVAQAIIEALEGLDLRYPEVEFDPASIVIDG
jgi:PPK2 family polyphosphate:nucleotide phosphotransferase